MYIYVNINNEIIESENIIEKENFNNDFEYQFYDFFNNGIFVLLNDELKEIYYNTEIKDLILLNLFKEYNELKEIYYLLPNQILPAPFLYGIDPRVFIIAHTLEEYQNGGWYELSDEQVAWFKEHPYATHEQIILMEMPAIPEDPVYVETLEDVKMSKLQELRHYDNSDNVNSFELNGIKAWFTPSERNNYAQSIQAAKVLGQETLMFFINNIALTVPTTMAEQMLAAVQLYADAAYIVTKQHEIAINALETIDEVKTYDFTTDYPDKLIFNLEA